MQGNKEYDLLKLSRYGSLERKDIKPKVHVANYSDKNIFKRGDLLDANMIINYVDEHIKCGDKKQDPITGIEIGSFSVDGETYDIKIKYASDKEEYLSVPEDWKNSGSTDNGDAIVNIVPGQTGEEDGRLTILTLEHANGNRDDIVVPNTKGDKGDAFTYDDFTPEQLASLKGADGTTYTPKVGDTTTLPAGQDATVTSRIVGTHVYFDFGIPKGAKGETVSPEIEQVQLTRVAYIHSNTKPNIPTGGTFYTARPSSIWQDGNDTEEWLNFPDPYRKDKIVWKTTRLMTSDGKAPQEDNWSDPVKYWEPEQPGSEIIPQYQKQAVAYLHSNTEPDTPTGGDFYTGVPSSTWDDGGTEEKWVTFPDSTRGKKIWLTTRLLTSDEKDPQEDSWSEPNLYWEPKTKSPDWWEYGYSLNPSTKSIVYASGEYVPNTVSCSIYARFLSNVAGWSYTLTNENKLDIEFTLVYSVDDGLDLVYYTSDDITNIPLVLDDIKPNNKITFKLYLGIVENTTSQLSSARRRGQGINAISVEPVATCDIIVSLYNVLFVPSVSTIQNIYTDDDPTGTYQPNTISCTRYINGSKVGVPGLEYPNATYFYYQIDDGNNLMYTEPINLADKKPKHSVSFFELDSNNNKIGLIVVNVQRVKDNTLGGGGNSDDPDNPTPPTTYYWYVGTTKPTSLDQCTTVTSYPAEQIYTNPSTTEKNYFHVLTSANKTVNFYDPSDLSTPATKEEDTLTIPGYKITSMTIRVAKGGSQVIKIS